MSFFGFDTSLPRDRVSSDRTRGIFENPDPFAEVARARAAGHANGDEGREGEEDAIDFEDTYDGLGDELDTTQDAFNDDTFGADDDVAAVGKDFDFFGTTAQVADVIGEEQVRYNLKHGQPTADEPVHVAAGRAAWPRRTGYEKYEEDPAFIPDLQAKSSVWGYTQQKHAPSEGFSAAGGGGGGGGSATAAASAAAAAAAATVAQSQAKKMLSLEEVEAQLRSQGSRPAAGLPAGIPAASGPTALDIPMHLQRAQYSGLALPEGYPQFPPDLLLLEQQARLPQAMPQPHPRSQLMHRQPLPPESYPMHQQPPAPMQPLLPPHLLQNANLQSLAASEPNQVEPARIAEQQQQQQQQQKQQQQQQQHQQQHQPSRAALPQHTRGPSVGLPQALPVITNPQQLLNLPDEQRIAYLMEDAKRAKRNHKIFLLSKGNGLMTPQDKNFITRIQLQQLVAAAGNVGDPDPEAVLAEDFYYQVYSQIRGAPRQHPHQPLGHFAQTYLFQTGNRVGGHGHRRQAQSADNHMQRMQQQVQRAVEAAKLKPKSKQLIIEGSLGKISFSNAKAPKPMLNIKRPESSDGAKTSRRPQTDLSPSDRKSILANIENVYSTLMSMEDLERTMPPPPTEDDAEAIQRHLEWRQKICSLNQKLWRELKVMEPIVPGSTTPHPFIAFLSYPKGKKAIPRIFHHLDQEQRVTILTMIVVNLDTLDVVRLAQLHFGEAQPTVAVREAVDLFSQAVMPSLLGYVNEAPFNIIIGLLGLVIAQTHVQLVARTKTGLGILTMLLSRAEIVKEAGQAAERDWQQWADKFDVLFDILEPILADIFPGPINVGDDMYVWQFLAAIGVGASPEQQQRLVIAVKDRVMETVAYSKTLPADMSSQRLGNVNLFMRAIGLDVELLG